ncbi:MAG: hypothetical protein WD733_26315 [Bryobacterales bacterium]
MQKQLFCIASALVISGSFALGQSLGQTPPSSPPPAPNSQPAPADKLTPQMLGEMLRSATTFHELVANMNLNRSLGPDQHIEGSDGRSHHSLERTVQTIGAGVGAGAAIGAMTRSENGVLIGALVGGAGGLIIDRILKRREDSRERAYGPAADSVYTPDGRSHQLDDRDYDQDRDPN